MNVLADVWRLRWPRYVYLIGLLLLLVLGLYGYHLATGITPPRAVLTITAVSFPIYWYGIWIMGGMALGAYVVATLVAERGQTLLEQTVPETVAKRPLPTLALPEPILNTLHQHRLNTVGDLLYRWGMNPHDLGLARDELQQLEAVLRQTTGVEPAWLDDAPWRTWNPEHVWNGLIWCLLLGVVGARLYHVLTPSPSMAAVGIHSPLDYFRNPYQLVNLRNGGLGIYGGIAGGALGLWLYARRYRLTAVNLADFAVIGLALGQAIGRWGNFFNQELYGRPTNLPWAVTIAPEYRLPAYAEFARFHPAFLYESIWSFLTFAALLWLLKQHGHKLLPGELTGLYLIAYAIGRTLLETVRLDSRTMALGTFTFNLPVATLVSLLLAVLVATGLLWRRWRGTS